MGRSRIKLAMTEDEIVCLYRQAKDQEAQIEILCDLNLCDRSVIENILEAHRIELVKEKKVKDHRAIFHERINLLKGKQSAIELAQKLGVTPSSVRGWVDGVSMPDIDRLVILSKYYSVPTDWLLGLDSSFKLPQTKKKEKKAALLSIHPKWCSLIFDTKEKTIEVRKKAPSTPGPFRCYVYQTMQSNFFASERGGTVIGYFDCVKVEKMAPMYCGRACLSIDEVMEYARRSNMKMDELFAWEIANPTLFEAPKTVNDFICFGNGKPVPRAPQSWCYVKEA